MTVTKMSKMLDQTKQQVSQLQEQMMNQFDVPEDKKLAASVFRKKLNEKAFEIMSFDNLHDEYIRLFTDV